MAAECAPDAFCSEGGPNVYAVARASEPACFDAVLIAAQGRVEHSLERREGLLALDVFNPVGPFRDPRWTGVLNSSPNGELRFFHATSVAQEPRNLRRLMYLTDHLSAFCKARNWNQGTDTIEYTAD